MFYNTGTTALPFLIFIIIASASTNLIANFKGILYQEKIIGIEGILFWVRDSQNSM